MIVYTGPRKQGNSSKPGHGRGWKVKAEVMAVVSSLRRQAMWAGLVVVALVAVVWAWPAGSQSGHPCDSPAVVSAGANSLRGDCYALWEFYEGLDDPGRLDDPEVSEGSVLLNWTVYPGSVGWEVRHMWRRWGPATPLSQWYGVVVQGGRVTALDLGNAGISGTLSPALGRLSALRYLHTAAAVNLAGWWYESPSSWTGPIPPELGGLKNLVELSVGGVSGSIPPELGKLRKLELLTGDESNLAGPLPAELGNLSSLKWLSFSNSEKPAEGGLNGPIPPELGRLTNLLSLRIRNHSLSGSIPPELGKLARLDWRLDLAGNELTGSIPPDLGKLKLRGHFDLSGNRLIGPIPAEIGQLTRMGTRRSHGHAELNLSDNRLTGPLPSELNKLTSLWSLNLSHNQLSGPLPTLDNFDKLAYLRLNDNAFTGPIPAGYVQLPELYTLNLSHNHLIGPTPAGLTNITELDLGYPFPPSPAPPDSPCLSELVAAYRRADCEALWEFFSTLEERGALDDVDHPGRWGPQTPLSEWHGVDVEVWSGEGGAMYEGRVVGLDLTLAGISGEVSPAIGDLLHLRSLRLGVNDLAGSFPYLMTRVEPLTDLDLSFTQLSRGLTSSLHRLRNLRHLDLRGTGLGEQFPPDLATTHPELEVRLPGRSHRIELSGPSYTAPGVTAAYSTHLPEGVRDYSYHVVTNPRVEVSHTTPTLISFTPTSGGTHRLALIVADLESGSWYVGKAGVTVFADLPTGPEARHVVWIANRGITHGCGGARFCPDKPVTRGQMAAFFNRALKLPADARDRFDDDTGSVFEDDINRLAAAAITEGCRTRQFCPGKPVTRGQMAAFLTRALNLPVAGHDYYADDTGTTHEDSINRLAAAGIAQPCDPGRYCPHTVLTRQEMAGLLYRARDHLPTDPGPTQTIETARRGD